MNNTENSNRPSSNITIRDVPPGLEAPKPATNLNEAFLRVDEWNQLRGPRELSKFLEGRKYNDAANPANGTSEDAQKENALESIGIPQVDASDRDFLVRKDLEELPVLSRDDIAKLAENDYPPFNPEEDLKDLLGREDDGNN